MSPSAPAATIPGYLAGVWKADPVNSEVAFSVRHIMISNIQGRFTSYDVTIVTGEDPVASSVAATIDLRSIDTGNETRDEHLRSADYFDAGKYPEMIYRSSGIRPAGGAWVVDGELNLHGVTRQVPLYLATIKFGPDQWGGQRAGVSAAAQVSRRDFGVGPVTPMDGGGVVVGDKVSISLEIEFALHQ